jgi:phage baseplate assembly protein gpV
MSMPEFVEAIESIIEEHLNNIHTAVPATVLSIDTATGLLTVQPKAQLKVSEKTVDYPIISGVPVVMPQSQSAGVEIAFPIAKGDSVLLVFSEQALDYWRDTGNDNVEIKYGLSNAIAIPGLAKSVSSTVKQATQNNEIIIKTQNNQITLSKSHIAIRGDIYIDGTLFINGEKLEP